MYLLTKKGQRFEWGPWQQDAFDTLKRLLVKAPKLSAPTREGDFVLDVDARGHGAGAILQQRQNGALRVIADASLLFSPAERSYCTTRQELAAVVFGLRKFRQYVLG